MRLFSGLAQPQPLLPPACSCGAVMEVINKTAMHAVTVDGMRMVDLFEGWGNELLGES